MNKPSDIEYKISDDGDIEYKIGARTTGAEYIDDVVIFHRQFDFSKGYCEIQWPFKKEITSVEDFIIEALTHEFLHHLLWHFEGEDTSRRFDVLHSNWFILFTEEELEAISNAGIDGSESGQQIRRILHGRHRD